MNLEVLDRTHGSVADLGVIDRTFELAHSSSVKSLLEIEEAIAKLSSEARKQLVQDLPALCPDAFPPDGWQSILQDPAPRAALISLGDKLDAEYRGALDIFQT